MEKGNILVVDDSPLILEFIGKFLSGNGYKIFTASNGIEAIDKAFRELPDLIILDVVMPKMNGYQTCRLLKSDPETRNIPIIMLTVKDHASDKYWGIQTGADAYLSKESVQSTLLKMVDDLLHKKQKTSPEKSLIRESTLINTIDIISKVNDLLDTKLFEATILNEMSSLIEQGIEDFKGIVNIVMDTLARILDYNVAVVVTIEEHDVECFLIIKNPVNEQYLEKVEEYTRNYLKANDIFLSPIKIMTVFDVNKIKQTHDAKEQKIAFFDAPIRYVNRLGGLIILAHDFSRSIESKEEGFFKTVLKQAYVIIENSRLYNKVKSLAITDALTGIYNHGFLYESLSKEYARAERNNLPLSFLMLDIDYFKKINDTYGHLQGDSVLAKLAQILKNNIRVYDTLGRYGGEEFSIILPQTKMTEGINLAERIRGKVEEHNFGDANTAITCTISIGISSYPDSEIKSVDELINKADKALYMAKTKGRNRVCA